MPRNLFSADKLERIYTSAVRLLDEMGMRVHNRQALEALEKFGARLDYPSQCAFFSTEVINRMLDIVRSDFADWERSRPSLPREVYTGGGGTCPYLFDDDKWQKRRANEADCILALKVLETSPVVCGEVPVYNSDCPPRFEALRCTQLAIETLNTTQAGGTDLFFPEQVPFAVELGKLYKNDPRWFLPAGNCPTTPLTVGQTVADLAVAMIPYAPNYAVPTMPIMGANAPVTPIGAAVVAVAEILGGWILAKALNADRPVSACALVGKMDMKRGEVTYIAPEVFVSDIAIVETFEVYLDLPCTRIGRYIDAETPGLQAIYEQMLRSVGCGLYSNLTSFDGTLDKGRVFSPTQLMLDCDVDQLLGAYTAEPEVSDDALGLEAILEIGFDANDYLTHKHTFRHMRDAWESSIYTRDVLKSPSDLHGTEKEVLARARELWQDNLKKYQPPNHSDDFLRDLRAISERAKKALSDSITMPKSQVFGNQT
jgi:trimethylamine--corrinoid protein Co-methyltransferase